MPVGVRSEDDTDHENKRMTRDEILALALLGRETHGFKRTQGSVKQLEACAWCHKTRDTATQTPLMKCTGCKDTLYCSRDHQKLDWEKHKLVCRRSKEDELRSELEPFIGKDGWEKFTK